MPAILAGMDAEIVVILGLMLFIVAAAFLYQTLIWMQQHTASLPVVGNPLQGALEQVKAGVRGAAHAAEGWLSGSIQTLTNGRVALTRWIMQNPLNGLHQLLQQLDGFAHAVGSDLAGFKNYVGSQLSALGSEMHQLYNASIGHADQVHAEDVAYTNATAQQLRAEFAQQLSTLQLQINAQLSGLHAQVLQLDGRLQLLEQYGRILAGLSGFEQATGTEFSTVLGQTSALGADLTHARAQLETLLPLSAVTALGADAVLNLTRVAEDPCWCLNFGAGAGLEGRVALLELGNL